MSATAVTRTDVGDAGEIAVIVLDDGRANALTVGVVEELEAALAALGPETAAVVLTGRPGYFCAGLDRAVTVPGREDDLEALLVRLRHLLVALLGEPRPLVAAVTGHALAAGTLLAMCADRVVAAVGDHSWGLVETRIGVAQEPFGLELARYRLGPLADSWALIGEVRSPAEAHGVGLVHRLTPSEDLLAAAVREARELAQVPAAAYATTKSRLRSTLCAALLPSGAPQRTGGAA